MGHLMLHCFYRCQMTFPTGPLQMYCTALFCISQKNTMIYMCVDGTACTSAFLSRLAGAAWSDVTQTHKQMYTHMMIHTCCWDCMYISLLTLSCWSCMEWCHTDTQTDGCTSAFLPCLAGVAWSDVTQTHKQMYTHWMIHTCCWDCLYIILISSCWSCIEWCHTDTQTDGCTSAFLPCLAGVAWSDVTQTHRCTHRHTNRCTHTGWYTDELLGLDVHQPSYLVLLESHGVMWHAESSFGVLLHLT